ncbi:hypothetical protein A3I99_01180 [Candidatus Kaiserbacteria bacterium RIFCSPLOWO2_02_FULL_45_11b]|uniref:Uncharacterized protein n=1 Tax=Candidatus Kaiserbacteria bacterium RIFCSPLOWO2_12_FULL_45_26 TaxID=1798525 RepID=A0A1F6FFP4_9BACT|nr:MAG: hypothetical protein A2929_01260 [Candidatus Kaiserbacteria bacterium RIFCSPLOWO2_01_FULL_45_25]OGG80934.1 MAG: hypothetical protein A3I99_01180 [Candidatus Kaiserbacteria bacterium RIFCSPLOWO2_02_FULL_45_11b]OGG84673.1 MAG: hypothetical protein A3G90_01125 [Candidatus Kaiserbacteria bacterium RIFCSPLOWO2_12_FULL_45_26]
MSQTHYPFTNTSFKAHEVAIYALGAVLVLIATTIGWVLWEPTVALPPHMAMTMAGGSLVFFLVWIFLLSTFDAKKTADRIHHLEQLESVLLQVVTKIDWSTTMDSAQKRFFLETYIDALRKIDRFAAEAHLKNGGFNRAGAVTQILEELRREKGTELKSKIDANTPELFEETGELNQTMEDYRLMGMAIRTPRPMPA